jgi:hypothetical protein
MLWGTGEGRDAVCCWLLVQEAVKRHLAPEGRLDYVRLLRYEWNVRKLEIDGIYVILLT